MKRKPRHPKKDRLVTLKLAIWSYLVLGTWQAIAGFISYLLVFDHYNIPISGIVYISTTYFKNSSPDFYGLVCVQRYYVLTLFQDAEQQRSLLQEAQTAFFVAVVVTRMGVVLTSKTRKISIFKQRLFGYLIFT
jgi:hypothetical protein